MDNHLGAFTAAPLRGHWDRFYSYPRVRWCILENRMCIPKLRFKNEYLALRAFQVVLMAKNRPTNAGDIRDAGLIPGLGRSPGGGNGNPLQYSCLRNPMDRRAWGNAVHRVAESDTTEATWRSQTHLAFWALRAWSSSLLGTNSTEVTWFC